MDTLATTLQSFFLKTIPLEPFIVSLVCLYHSSIHAADILGRAANPPSGSSSRAILLKEGPNLFNSPSNKTGDFLYIFYHLSTIVTSGVDSDLGGRDLGEVGVTIPEGMQDAATVVLKRLRDAKLAIEYRIRVGALSEGETSTPPVYSRLMKVSTSTISQHVRS